MSFLNFCTETRGDIRRRGWIHVLVGMNGGVDAFGWLHQATTSYL
jgi:hypothetical protein